MDLFILSVKVVLACMALGIAGPMVLWAGVAFHQRAEALSHNRRLRRSHYLMAYWQQLLTDQDPAPYSAEKTEPYPGISE